MINTLKSPAKSHGPSTVMDKVFFHTERLHAGHIYIYNYISTMQAVMKLIKYLFEKRDKGEVLGCLFIDFSKAFNMVSHEILIEKLMAGGIIDKALEWIVSYLDNRKQCTRGNNINSRVIQVE